MKENLSMAEDTQDFKQEEFRKAIKKTVHAHKGKLSEEEVKLQEQALIDIFENGMLPAQALGFDANFMDYVYKFAYTLYQKNEIEEASQLYRWLKVMVPIDQKYTIALTHCYIQQKNWLAAVAMLMELGVLNSEDPLPFEKMCDCLIEAKDYASALMAIEQAIKRAADKQEYMLDKEKWLMTYDYLLSQLEIDPAIIEKVKAENESIIHAKNSER
ncbi:hypothetical protein NEOC84_001923|nr:hypothetical protein [Neochlamydia sp. AcF84]